MSEKPISPLRQRMIEDMSVRALLRVSHTINQVQAHYTRLRITSDPIKYP
jgi:hypothetical protein